MESSIQMSCKRHKLAIRKIFQKSTEIENNTQRNKHIRKVHENILNDQKVYN